MNIVFHEESFILAEKTQSAGIANSLTGDTLAAISEKSGNTITIMKRYNLDWLIENFEAEKRIKFLFFWGNQRDRNGNITSTCFSQWWISPFIVNNITYQTAEHWMMANKALLFNDQEIYKKILVASSPGEAKDLGREIKNFDQSIWENHRFEIVVQGNIHKFSQHKNLLDFLFDTKERVLVEASPVDTIWGIGLTAESEKAKNPLSWNGQNLLGFALMEVRDILRNRN